MHETLAFLLRHGYWVLFTWVLGEQLGVPVPSAPILFAMGALSGMHLRSFGEALWLAFAAAVAADSAWYTLGRTKGRSVLRLLCRISLEPDSCVSSTQKWFGKLGGWALVIAKFVPGLGSIAAPMSGLARLPFWKFLLADGLGIGLWAGTYLGVGYLFRDQIEDLGRLAGQTGASLAAALAILALWPAWKFLQRRQLLRALRIARISAPEVMARLSEFTIVDLRAAAEVEWDGLRIPGALWFDRADLALHHERIPRDKDIVLYCT